LAKIDGDRVEAVDLRESPEGDLVRCLLAEEEALWVGTEQGLVRWTAAGQERLTATDGLPNNFVYSLYRDREGILWVGTGGGLARQAGEAFVSFKSAHGLYSDVIFSISEDEAGHLWFSSSRGIFRVDRRQLPATGPDPGQPIYSVWFDSSDGMRSSECNGGTQPAVLKAKDGRFWFPTVAGVAVVDPQRLKAPAPQSPLLIEGVLADGLWLGAAEPVKIPAGTETVEVRYSSPTFLSPRKISFRYRLAGFDRKWNQAGFRRQAIFTRLPHGRYRFVVSAADEEKVWSLRNAELQIEVLPFFYQRWWFLGLLSLAFLAVLLALYRWWLRRHRLNEGRLLEQVQERTQELQEANRKLERMASVDSLTGIANQRRFRKALDQEWRRAVRQGAPLALMLVDIDFFKAYNDTYGHLQGDRCLVQVATALAETLNRGGDLVARYGGEEFVAILSETDAEGARRSGERVRQAVEDLAVEHRRSAVSPWVTVSVGVAATEPIAAAPFDAADRLLGEADAALYASKRSGRNRVT
jgi:diguanylate cyclase (GGDEF)-like protein